MLLLSSLVAHPFNSFFSVQAQRRILCSAKGLVPYPLIFLHVGLESYALNRLSLETNLLSCFFFALQDKSPQHIRKIWHVRKSCTGPCRDVRQQQAACPTAPCRKQGRWGEVGAAPAQGIGHLPGDGHGQGQAGTSARRDSWAGSQG